MANGQGSVVRQGEFAYDLRELIKPAADTIADNRPNWNAELKDGSLLIRAEVWNPGPDTSDNIGHEHWILVKDGIVIAEKAFDTVSGVGTRSLMQPSDGNVYFQQIEFAINSNDIVEQPNSGNVVSVYKITPDRLMPLLKSNATTLIGQEGVTQIASYTKLQLGGPSSGADVIAIVDGFFPVNVFIPNSTDVLVNSTVIDWDSNADDSEKSFLSRFGSMNDNSPNWQTLLNGEIGEIKINSDSVGTAVFLSYAYQSNSAMFLNTLTGQLSNIPRSLFDAIQEDGTLPPGLGNSGNNTLEGTDLAENMYGFGGNDTLIGRGGNDWLFGGNGNDTLNGGDGNDMLFGGLGADRIELGSGNDTVVLTSDRDSFRPLTNGPLTMDTIFGFGDDDLIDVSRILAFSNYTDFTIVPPNQSQVKVSGTIINDGGFTDAVIIIEYIGDDRIDLFDVGFITEADFIKAVQPTNWTAIDSPIDSFTSVFINPGSRGVPVTKDNPATSNINEGLLATITFGLEDGADSFEVIFSDKFELSSVEGTSYKIAPPPTTIGNVSGPAENELIAIFNNGSLGVPNDNEIHFFQSFDQANKTSILDIRYDTNPAVGETSLSSIISMQFDSTFVLSPDNFRIL